MSTGMNHNGTTSESPSKNSGSKLNWNYSLKDYGFASILTWKILGALTRDANAEDRVAEKIPAEISGANPDTMLITWKQNNYFFERIRKSILYEWMATLITQTEK